METKTKTRRIIKSGNGLIITLPKEFTDRAGLKKGDTVGIAYDGLFVIVNPNQPKREVKENELAD